DRKGCFQLAVTQADRGRRQCRKFLRPGAGRLATREEPSRSVLPAEATHVLAMPARWPDLVSPQAVVSCCRGRLSRVRRAAGKRVVPAPKSETRKCGQFLVERNCMTKRYRYLSEAQKRSAVARVAGGEAVSTVARSIGVNRNRLYEWCRRYQKGGA